MASQVIAVGTQVTATAIIANAGTVSAAIDTKGLTLVGISLPAAFTGTTLSFQASLTLAGTYKPVQNTAGLISITTAQGRYLVLDPKDFQGLPFIKIVSGSAEAAERTLELVMKGI